MKILRTRTTRRTLFAGIAAASAVAMLASPVRAATVDDAARFIDDLARETIAAVSDASLDRAARAARLRGLLDRSFDGETISRFVLGSHWRGASEAEKREFVELFRAFTALTYAKRFEAYSGQTLKVTGTREQSVDGDGRRKVLVQTALRRNDGTPVKVDWRLRESADGWRIYDVVVEGVSMLLTQRSEFASVIQQQGGLPGLLRQLRNRSAQLENGGSAG